MTLPYLNSEAVEAMAAIAPAISAASAILLFIVAWRNATLVKALSASLSARADSDASSSLNLTQATAADLADPDKFGMLSRTNQRPCVSNELKRDLSKSGGVMFSIEDATFRYWLVPDAHGSRVIISEWAFDNGKRMMFGWVVRSEADLDKHVAALVSSGAVAGTA